jgi:integrase
MAKATGRRKGSRNRGYYFIKDRGWVAKVNGRRVPLEYPNGDRMRDERTPPADIKAAYFRLMSTPTDQVETTDVSVLQVCNAYLATVEDSGAKSTLVVRENTLFDFCFGLPSRFVRRNGKEPAKPKKGDHIHPGFGRMAVSELKPLHIDKWLQAHPNWKGARRTKIQAVKRALNYGVEAGMIPANPIKGYKTPKQNARVTYLTPEQEAALLEAANPALAMAIKVCIRTGARPGCEFAKLTARHVQIQDERMEWTFQPSESKTKKRRIIRITDPEIIAIVRHQIEEFPTGEIFRNTAGKKWSRELLTEKFRKLKNKLIEKDIAFDADACMYSCRHTYAKRTLQGYWTGRPTNIETLAQLMGNSPQVCHDHYLQFCDSYAEPLWDSA